MKGPDVMLRGLQRVQAGGKQELWARGAAALLLALLGAVNFYRAATQSITADEAFTYNHFAGGDVPVGVYDANNHVLFTWLARASVAALGLSEFSLRLPAVLAGCGYLAGVYCLSAHWFRPTWLFLPAVLSLSLNPFLLDFLSAARGYGLAQAFFLWATYELARALEAPALPATRVYRGAVHLALAVAANLNFAFPGGALAGVFCLMACARHGPAGRRLLWLAARFLAPGFALAAAILAWPLRTATREAFYAGVQSLTQTLQGAIFYSFCHARPAAPSWLQNRLWEVSNWFIPGVLVLSAVTLVWLLVVRRGPAQLDGQESFLVLVGSTSLVTLGLLIAARHGLGVKYPVDRTAVYWIPLFTLVSLGLIGAFLRRRLLWLPAAGLAAFLAAAVVQYALQFNTRYYAQWRYDAGTKRIAEAILRREAGRPARRVRIGATWLFEPSLNFYRQRYRMSWLENITRDGPRGDYDYYVLEGADRQLVEQMKLRVLYRDPLSEVVLAEPGGMLQSRP